MTRNKCRPHEKRYWTPAQLNALRAGYADGDLDALAVEVAHARSAMVKMANSLGLKRSSAAMAVTRKKAAVPNSGSFKAKHGRAGDGKTRTDPTYLTWMSMHQRCDYPSHKSYAAYGGRGIKVCERWKDFSAFLADMGDRPAGKTLDRHPDKNGNYEPGNCRWATDKEQQRNRRSSRAIEFNGITKTLVEWSESSGIRPDTIAWRIRRGWPLELVFSHPVSFANRNVPSGV